MTTSCYENEAHFAEKVEGHLVEKVEVEEYSLDMSAAMLSPAATVCSVSPKMSNGLPTFHLDEDSQIGNNNTRILALIANQRTSARLVDLRMADSMIQYELLQAQLQQLQDTRSTEIEAAKLEIIQDRCCVCLDDLGCSFLATTTACGHVMHTTCLVETLADGTIKGCPMCRTDISELAGQDMSGDVFRFMCSVRMNADVVQSCTRTQKKEILRELGSCEQVAKELEKWSLLRLLRRSEQIERRTALKGRLFNIRKRLQLLEQFSYTNNEGFLYICKQIADSLSKDLSDSCLSNFTTSMDCFCDVGEQIAPPSPVQKHLLTSTKALTDSCVAGAAGEYVCIAQRICSILKNTGIDVAEIEAHEKMLRGQRGTSSIALPSFVEAHFKAVCDTWSSLESPKPLAKEGSASSFGEIFSRITAAVAPRVSGLMRTHRCQYLYFCAQFTSFTSTKVLILTTNAHPQWRFLDWHGPRSCS